jgi:hypothetical protein
MASLHVFSHLVSSRFILVSLNMDQYYLDNHRTSIKHRYKGWELERIPGCQHDGLELSAFWAQRLSKKYWSFKLDYDEIDWRYPTANDFNIALKEAGPDIIAGDLFEKHKDNLPRHARLQSGGWRWWNGSGLTRELLMSCTPQ